MAADPFEENILTHGYDDIVLSFTLFVRNNTTIYGLAVNGNGFYALFYVVRVYNLDIVSTFTELSGQFKITKSLRNTRINAESLMRRIYAQDVLGYVYESPCSRTGQPAVLCFAVEFGVSAGNHLGIYVRLCSVDLAELFHISRAGLLIDLESSVAASDHGFGDGNPRIVMTEDTCVLLVSRRIGGDFAKL